MHSNPLSVACLVLLTFQITQSVVEFSAQANLIFMDLLGEVTPVTLSESLFSVIDNSLGIDLQMHFPQSGTLLAKASNNKDLSKFESGDYVFFVQGYEGIPLGYKLVDDFDGSDSALDLFNSDGDNSKLKTVIKLSKHTQRDGDILKIRNLVFSHRVFLEKTVIAHYYGNYQILADPEDRLADLEFDPNSPEVPAGMLADYCLEVHLRPLFGGVLKSNREFLKAADTIIDSFKPALVQTVDFSDFKPKLNAAVFIDFFNAVIKDGLELNLLVYASMQFAEFKYGILPAMPKAVSKSHSQQLEDQRRFITRDSVFFWIFELLCSHFEPQMNSDIMDQKELTGQVLEQLGQKLLEIPKAPASTVQYIMSQLQRGFVDKMTSDRVEVMFWMNQFKQEVYDFVDNYVEAVASSRYFQDLFVKDSLMDLDKTFNALKYIYPERYPANVMKYTLFTQKRRDLIIL